MMLPFSPNKALERTATRFAFTFCVAKNLLLRATPGPHWPSLTLSSLDDMREITAILGVALICVTGNVATTFAQTPLPPKNGYVPDAATAIKIAVAVWTPIYGERRIANEKPYRATLKDGVWTVEGSMPLNPLNEPMFGGVALIEIAKSDGRILRVEHGE